MYAIKEEVEALNNKLKELTEDELKQVAGGGNLVRPVERDVIIPDKFCPAAETAVTCPRDETYRRLVVDIDRYDCCYCKKNPDNQN